MENTKTITLQVNGKPKTFAPKINLPQFLEKMQFNPYLVVIEYNGEILHREYWENTFLKTGDKLEIVTIVGGG
ncbi:sulfur carrier protein ThiS [Candidatus Atelocyanobacterium thalassae]|uniref:Thiamine biosynthesis protein ThiS n=2 Tax=Candidatus Atelocyanobacterium thalassae TaxID=713887 RepID=A0A086CGY4_9CHRO|nr:sulfur carrier protein ThiS [Candidatus Atelocyanobacterium thalassa]KFF41448.1 MAG: thiamine biosynthesis protein ThiS [Candidatus Atelocyanobacterium thalassa isolate SIO64986]BDA39657.1 hypothetical protein CPARK_000049600 [cyanobacterium endosymbiont of Braarudosphaera bigelowii]